MAGVDIPDNCTNTQVDVLLDELYFRLNFYDTISKAVSSVVSIYPNLKYSQSIHICAWMNDRILGNCNDTLVYDSTVRETLNSMCGGRGRRRCDPQLCLLEV